MKRNLALLVTLILSLGLAGCKEEKNAYGPSTDFKAMAINVSADPGVEYVIFDVVKRQDNLIEVFSRRKGSSGVSYARRLVNCQNWTFMYLSEGDTIDELSILHPDSKMSKLTQGSSSTAVSYNGCKSAGLIN